MNNKLHNSAGLKQFWLCIGLVASLQVFADNQPQHQPLTLQQCRAMALKQNKSMEAATHQEKYAHHTALSFRANFLPNFELNGMGAYSNIDGSFGMAGGNLPTFLPDAAGQPIPNGGFAYFPGMNLNYKLGWMYTGGISVEQPIYMGGKIRTAYRIARLGRQMALANRKLTEAEVLLESDQAYTLVVKAQEMLEVARSYNLLLEELKKNVESAVRHGLKPKNDLLKVQVKLNESELNIRRAENGLRLAKMNLCHCIGLPLISEVEIDSRLPEVPDRSQLAASPTSDITQRPEYALLQHQEEIARQQVKLQQSEMLPQVGVRGSYDYLHGVEVNDRTLFDKGAFTALLNVKVPLFHFGERIHKVRAAKAKWQQTQAERENLNEQMTLELTQAANNLDEARLELAISERSLLQADENRRVSRSQYDAGTEPLSDLLEAQLMWQQAWQTHVESRSQIYLKYVEYLKAAGRLQP